MTIPYLSSAPTKKLARQLLNKYTCQLKNCHFYSIYPNLHEQNKLLKGKFVKEKLAHVNAALRHRLKTKEACIPKCDGLVLILTGVRQPSVVQNGRQNHTKQVR